MQADSMLLSVIGLCLPFFSATFLLAKPFPRLRFVPAALLAVFGLLLVASAGTQPPQEAAAQVALAMVLGLVFLMTLGVAVYLGIRSNRVKPTEDVWRPVR